MAGGGCDGGGGARVDRIEGFLCMLPDGATVRVVVLDDGPLGMFGAGFEGAGGAFLTGLTLLTVLFVEDLTCA